MENFYFFSCSWSNGKNCVLGIIIHFNSETELNACIVFSFTMEVMKWILNKSGKSILILYLF